MILSKALYIIFGTISLVIGVIGIALPVLPATPFILLSAACYLRSSDRMYGWLINHSVFGNYIKMFREHKAMTVKSKIISLIAMWLMISVSIFFLLDDVIFKYIVFALGLIGTLVILFFRTYSLK